MLYAHQEALGPSGALAQEKEWLRALTRPGAAWSVLCTCLTRGGGTTPHARVRAERCIGAVVLYRFCYGGEQCSDVSHWRGIHAIRVVRCFAVRCLFLRTSRVGAGVRCAGLARR